MNIREAITQRILLLDGAMGTMVQQANLPDEAYSYHGKSAPGLAEVLNLTNPAVITSIHQAYLKAGADIIETNTFNANRISLAEYHLEGEVTHINKAAVHAAKEAIRLTKKNAYIAGVLGPTPSSLSFSPKVEDPLYRNYTFDQYVEAYREQARALLEGGVDLFLIETLFDTLIAKSAIIACQEELKKAHLTLPIIVSVTFSDTSGRTLSGQSLQAFLISLASFDLFAVGINCSTGPKEMIPLLTTLHEHSPFYTSAHPNAGFPDEEGHYTLNAKELATQLQPLIQRGQLNIVGGCCGTTPEHIKALKEIIEDEPVRVRKARGKNLELAGLNPVTKQEDELVVIGERTNVAGSRRFRRLIVEEKWEEALSIARDQIQEGARVLDICMDDPLLDAKEAMVSFLRYSGSDPTIAHAALMIDSSDWSVIEAALKELQGRAIINSISLKEGEEPFIYHAQRITSYGHAFVVMLFDEEGQASTYERKIAIADRSYNLLKEAGIDDRDIIFDPNVLAIGTGIEEHDTYAKAFIDATAEIKSRYPNTFISGGISNLSFAYRGNNPLRSALHEVFLDVAHLDMAILNPALYHQESSLDEETRKIITKAFLEGDSSELLSLALTQQPTITQPTNKIGQPPEERLTDAIMGGEVLGLEKTLDHLSHLDPLFIIDSILMEAMKQVGSLFGEGKLFLPQVVRSARAMKTAVDILHPRLSASLSQHTEGESTKKALLATVKGDVHDIGKNMVGLVLSCNGFEVIDLGVMVDEETILKAAIEHNVDLVGLSGLITPSLKEMARVIALFDEHSLNIPIFVGGATTSELHTALKLNPLSRAPVIQTKDASAMALTAVEILGSQGQERLGEIHTHYEELRVAQQPAKESPKPGKAHPIIKKTHGMRAKETGIFVTKEFTLSSLVSKINWRMYAQGWGVKYDSEEGRRVISEAQELLKHPDVVASFEKGMKIIWAMMDVESDDSTMSVGKHVFYFLRDEERGLSLSDMIAPTDSVGFFVATSGLDLKNILTDDPFRTLSLKLLADRLAEVLAQEAQALIANLWVEKPTAIIRPAIGYPAWSDHSEKKTLFELLCVEEISLSSSYAMDPQSSVCGAVIGGKGVKYFTVNAVSQTQLSQYAKRKGMSESYLASFLGDMGY